MTPFMGNTDSTVGIAVSGVTQRVLIQATNQNSAVMVHNDGTATVWITFGGDAVTTTIPNGATRGGQSIGPGVQTVLRLPSTHVAAIAAGATGTIYFTPGEGI